MTSKKSIILMLSPVAAALTLALPNTSFAQSNADLANELMALKARITQLEGQISVTPAAAAGGVDPAEFNRVRVKTEALEDNIEASGFKGLKINGWMDPTFISSQNRKASSFSFLNNFDGRDANNGYSYDNSFFGMAMLDFQKEMDGGTKFRLTLAPQKGAASAYNLGSIVHEASVSVPLGDLSTRLIAGQIPDWSGYEYIPSTQNKLITHNLLFDFTMPNYYTGAGLEVSSGKWIMKGLLGNLNSNRFGKADKSPIATYRVDYAKGEFSGFGFAGQHGKSADTKTNMLEVDGYFIRGDWSLFGQLSSGTLGKGADMAKWTGASALAAYKITPRLEAIARLDLVQNKKTANGVFGSVPTLANCPDYDKTTETTLSGNTTPCTDGVNGFGSSMFDDSANGNGWQPTGNGVNRSALSLGLNYQYTSNVSFKAEVRQDRASGAVFAQQDGSYRRSNRTLGLSTVVSF